MLGTCLENVRNTVPLVHNITNYVTVNDVANILLACGGSPIMSDEPEDVEDITSICGGLNINIGTLNQRSIEGMFRAGAKANALGHVVLLDPVGAGASALRTNTAVELMEKIKFTVIRGNISEIKTLALGSGIWKPYQSGSKLGVSPAVRVIRVVNIAAQGQVCQLRIPKAFRYEGENVEIPASVSDDRFCHFSGNHCFGNGRDILRFFAHGVVTDCSRTVRLRNIAQLEAVPALRAARDDSFYTSGCEETSRNMAQHLYFLAFDGCFHDLFREQVFRQPFYGRYDVIVPHTVSF